MSVEIKKGKKSNIDEISILNGKTPTLPEIAQHLINVMNNEDELHPGGMGSEMTWDFIEEACSRRKIDASMMSKYQIPSKTQLKFLKTMGVI